MDLKSLMNNDGSSEVARPSLSRDSQQRNGIQPPPPRTTSGSYGSPQAQNNPYAPRPAPPLYQQASSVDSRASNGGLPSSRLTPIHTPVQTPGHMPGSAGGYPFPTGPHQSPSQSHQQQQQQQQHRGPDGYQVVTPGTQRGPAPIPVYQYNQHGQHTASSPYGAPPPPPTVGLRQSASHPSMSPTPPTIHQQRDGSTSTNQGYGHAQYAVHGQHPSQPSTPLGRPASAHYPPRFVQAQSPFASHHRTLSGASHTQTHSIASNSPAQPYPGGAGSIIESPSTYGRPGPPGPLDQPGQARRVGSGGGYMSETERERSVSVSPKTMTMPRQGSSASHYSTDPMSARNSVSAPAPQPSEYERTSRPSQPQHEPQYFRGSNDTSAPGISPLTTTRQTPVPHVLAAPSPSSRSSQTPKVKNLLNDSNMASSSPIRQSPSAATAAAAAAAAAVAAAASFSAQTRQFSPAATNGAPSYNSYSNQVKTEPPLIKSETSGFPEESLLQQPVPAYTPAPVAADDYGKQTLPQKRAAESTPEPAHPAKRAKKRYAEPPIWARFARSNPRYGNNPQSLAPPPQQLVRRPSPRPQPRPSPQQAPSTNGHAPPSALTNGTPSAPPPNSGVPNVHNRLGPWEYNINNVLLMNDVLKEVGDFLFMHATRQDIGTGDARHGVLEVEAKLGTLLDRRTMQRINCMSATTMVLDHRITSKGDIRFESFMTELQHKQMNEYLNRAIQGSIATDRVRLAYKHRYERDSFATLSRVGYECLPESAKAHINPKHALKLRTTVDTKAPKGSPQSILGRIVKVRLDDLDIHCPRMDFDCRISVNVEVDLNNRPDIDPSLIINPSNPGDEISPDRMKDRLSYKHLAYSVDLTQVTLPNNQKTHELEIEVDTARLREEAMRLTQGQDSAYEMLVDGLLSNVFTLMKAQKEIGAAQAQQGR